LAHGLFHRGLSGLAVLLHRQVAPFFFKLIISGPSELSEMIGRLFISLIPVSPAPPREAMGKRFLRRIFDRLFV
jgi:hypothetical protein